MPRKKPLSKEEADLYIGFFLYDLSEMGLLNEDGRKILFSDVTPITDSELLKKEKFIYDEWYKEIQRILEGELEDQFAKGGTVSRFKNWLNEPI